MWDDPVRILPVRPAHRIFRRDASLLVGGLNQQHTSGNISGSKYMRRRGAKRIVDPDIPFLNDDMSRRQIETLYTACPSGCDNHRLCGKRCGVVLMREVNLQLRRVTFAPKTFDTLYRTNALKDGNTAPDERIRQSIR